MSKDMKSIDDVLPPELREAQALSLDAYFDKPLAIHNCREVTGAHGVYMRILVQEVGKNEEFYLATGGSQPIEILRYLKENKLFPVKGVFVKAGRAIILKGVE